MPAWAYQANQPVTYPRMFLQIATAHGGSRQAILRHADVSSEAIEDPAGRISFRQTLGMFEAIARQVPGKPVGFESGLNLPLTAHGSLGYALMCAGTPREAISILERFWHLRGRGVSLVVTESERKTFFEILPEAPFPDYLREMMFSSVLTSICQATEFVLPSLASNREIWLQGREPEDFQTVAPKLPTVRFGMPRAGIVLYGDRGWMDSPMPTANPEALAQAVSQCERESALSEPMDNIVHQVRTALTLGQEGYPSPETLADRLHLTPRTFRRRLREQGQNYRLLLEEARRRDSCDMLDTTELDIHRIGELLGYQEPANFTRAFRSWTGMPPSQWRRKGPEPE